MSGGTNQVAVEELQARRGEEVGRSGWFTIGQSLVDRFADVTGDNQYIHVDPERARQTEFGGTIAHGFLTLSLLSAMCAEAVPTLENASVTINAGFDRVRFVSPVPTGSQVRGVFTLVECNEQKPGYWRTLLRVEVEIEGADKPALVADWILISGITS